MRVLYVDVDTLRPDHTGPYGYARALTPHLDRIAARGMVFDRYYASDSPCVPSRAALWSGRPGILNGVIGHYGTGSVYRHDIARSGHLPEQPLLGRHMERHGYRTASVSCFAERHLAYWFTGNFRETIRPSASMGNDEDAADVQAAAGRWLAEHGREDDWLLHVHFWDPHTDYRVKTEWIERAAAAGPAPAWPDEQVIADHQSVFGPHTAEDLHGVSGERAASPHSMPDRIADRSDFERYVNGYDGAVMYWDHHLGLLLGQLEELGILDDTAIIVSADHGDALGEGGVYGEHGLADEPTHHVPLILRWPGLTDRPGRAAARCDALLSNLDLAPTLCDLLDIPVPAGWYGSSFAAALRGRPLAGAHHVVLSHGAHSYQRAVLTRRHLYVRTLHPGCFEVGPEALYDLKADPHAEHDLIAELPSVRDEVRAALGQWWHETAGRPGAAPDPMQTSLDPGPTVYFRPDRYLDHLMESGRTEKAKRFREHLDRWGL